MTDYTQRLPVEHIDEGGADAFAQDFFSLWRRTEGCLTEEYENFAPRLVIFDGVPNVNDSPDLLECGFDALPLKLLGSTWTEDAEHLRQFLPPDYRAMIGQAYYDAITQRRPVFDIVKADMRNDAGDPVDALYHRLILPCRESDFEIVLSYSFEVGTPHPVLGASSASENRVDCRPGRQDRASLFRAVAAATQRRSCHTG